MLEAWTTLISEFGSVSDELHHACAMRIFNKYVQCHLAPPDGSRCCESPDGGGKYYMSF